jgi:Cu-Zn family superoxide dismutase
MKRDISRTGVGLSSLVVALVLISPSVNKAWGAPPLTAELISGKGQNIKGKFEFKEVGSKVEITGKVEGLPPNSKNGIHIHENPKNEPCKGDFTSVGGHFNPTSKTHGSPEKGKDVHSGDLGNLEANSKGVAQFNLTKDGLKLGGPSGLKGRALIIHAKADDFKTQPTGGAGDRIGCAILQ